VRETEPGLHEKKYDSDQDRNEEQNRDHPCHGRANGWFRRTRLRWIEHVHEDACARRLAIAATLRLGLEFVRLLVE
jgi:rhamnogalacturonyl hydrolase YesR